MVIKVQVTPEEHLEILTSSKRGGFRSMGAYLLSLRLKEAFCDGVMAGLAEVKEPNTAYNMTYEHLKNVDQSDWFPTEENCLSPNVCDKDKHVCAVLKQIEEDEGSTVWCDTCGLRYEKVAKKIGDPRWCLCKQNTKKLTKVKSNVNKLDIVYDCPRCNETFETLQGCAKHIAEHKKQSKKPKKVDIHSEGFKEKVKKNLKPKCQCYGPVHQKSCPRFNK